MILSIISRYLPRFKIARGSGCGVLLEISILVSNPEVLN
jgi:hypothetical protein